jgi:hypothetical protein
MWNSRLGCLMPGRMPSPQIMDLIKSSFLTHPKSGRLHSLSNDETSPIQDADPAKDEHKTERHIVAGCPTL